MGITDADAAELVRALTRLLDDTRHRVAVARHSPLVERVTAHVGAPPAELPNVVLARPPWEHVNLHLGLAAYLKRHTPDADWFGVAGAHRAHEDLAGILAGAEQYGSYRLGAVDYAIAAVGPDRTVDVVNLGFVATTAPDGAPAVVGLRGVQGNGSHACELQVLAVDRATATAVRDEVERLAAEHDVHRGAVLSFDVTEHYGNELVSFLPRPEVDAADVVLPDGVLATIEAHVVRSADRSAELTRLGQHLKRGLLLHGPPGTGKTHTVRYLLGRLRGSTVVVLSGRAMRLLPRATALVRRLQPAVLVIEDVDLVAEDRSMHSMHQPMLFELLNRIDGVESDADVTFVLTTNRVADMERALVERPGRVDLAVEVPLPDAGARERLLRLYARGSALDEEQVADVVAGTEGVTASFVRELVRRAVLHSLDTEGVARLDGGALPAALAELSRERSALTRALLGG